MSIISPLPNTLVNGTPMDAPQVMADFNQIYNDVNNNAAHSGVNGDITQLTNLSTPLSVSQGGSGLTSGLNLADGQVQVSTTSNTITVTPFDGGGLVINGVWRPISAPFSVTPSVSISTTYYIYAAMDVVPTPTVEVSTTGWTLDSFGRKNKTGDVTRRLIGMIRADSSGNFQNSVTVRGLLNYFNRRSLSISGAVVSGGSASVVPTFVALGTSAIVSFLTWGDETTFLVGSGFGSSATVGVVGEMLVSVDGDTPTVQSCVTTSTANSPNTYAYPRSNIFTEGIHTANVAVCSGSAVTNNYTLHINGIVRG